MDLDSFQAEGKTLIELVREVKPEECPDCGERTLYRCGAISKCYGRYCEDPDPFDTDYISR